MYFKNKISITLLAVFSLGLASCQDQKKERASPEVFRQHSEQGPPSTTTVQNVVVESEVRVEEYRDLAPILDTKFHENIRKKTEQLEQSNAKLVNSGTTHFTEKDANINSYDNVTMKSDKNTSLTELDAVEQAIQAAAPALEDNTEN